MAAAQQWQWGLGFDYFCYLHWLAERIQAAAEELPPADLRLAHRGQLPDLADRLSDLNRLVAHATAMTFQISQLEDAATDQTRHLTRIRVAATSHAVAALTRASARLGEAVAEAGPLHQRAGSPRSPAPAHHDRLALDTIDRAVSQARQHLHSASQVVRRYADQVDAPAGLTPRTTTVPPPPHRSTARRAR